MNSCCFFWSMLLKSADERMRRIYVQYMNVMSLSMEVNLTQLSNRARFSSRGLGWKNWNAWNIIFCDDIGECFPLFWFFQLFFYWNCDSYWNNLDDACVLLIRDFFWIDWKIEQFLGQWQGKWLTLKKIYFFCQFTDFLRTLHFRCREVAWFWLSEGVLPGIKRIDKRVGVVSPRILTMIRLHSLRECSI